MSNLNFLGGRGVTLPEKKREEEIFKFTFNDSLAEKMTIWKININIFKKYVPKLCFLSSLQQKNIYRKMNNDKIYNYLCHR